MAASDDTMPAFETITVEMRGPAAWLTLDRPEVMNSFTPQMIDEIDAALAWIEATPDVRVLVITGRGRAFCAGGDIAFVQEAATGKPHDTRSRFLERLMAVLRRLEELPVPVIAAVNGIALAGGLEIILCCDLVIAAEGAKIGDAHATYGFVPGAGSSVHLPRKIGMTRAKYLLFTARHVPAETMRDWGLVNEVVAPEKLVESVDALVEDLAGKSPLTLRRTKRIVNDQADQPLDSALRLEHMMGDLHWTSDDMKEGVAAFNEKRKPVYRGE